MLFVGLVVPRVSGALSGLGQGDLSSGGHWVVSGMVLLLLQFYFADAGTKTCLRYTVDGHARGLVCIFAVSFAAVSDVSVAGLAERLFHRRHPLPPHHALVLLSGCSTFCRSWIQQDLS